MNYKKVITAILLVSDGSVNHKYFLENFNISNEDLLNIFDEINDELKEKDYGFYIKYDGKSSDLVTLSSISTELAESKAINGVISPAPATFESPGLISKPDWESPDANETVSPDAPIVIVVPDWLIIFPASESCTAFVFTTLPGIATDLHADPTVIVVPDCASI